MASPTVDWSRVTFDAALAGGVFWALAAQVLIASRASAAAIIAICVAATAAIIAGVIVYRRNNSPGNRTHGASLILAPLTGAAPVIVFGLVGLLVQAIF